MATYRTKSLSNFSTQVDTNKSDEQITLDLLLKFRSETSKTLTKYPKNATLISTLDVLNARIHKVALFCYMDTQNPNYLKYQAYKH